MEALTPELVAWIGILIGVFARIMIPYLRKVWIGEIKEFDLYYLWVGFAGLILSLIASVLISPGMLINPDATFVQLITANFIVGFGSTSIINEIFALKEVTEKPTSTPPT